MYRASGAPSTPRSGTLCRHASAPPLQFWAVRQTEGTPRGLRLIHRSSMDQRVPSTQPAQRACARPAELDLRAPPRVNGRYPRPGFPSDQIGGAGPCRRAALAKGLSLRVGSGPSWSAVGRAELNPAWPPGQGRGPQVSRMETLESQIMPSSVGHTPAGDEPL